jgi:YVTN family beta-propeller protein
MIVITPDGKTAYSVSTDSGTVTPIDTATNTAGPPIKLGGYPYAIVITPYLRSHPNMAPIMSRPARCRFRLGCRVHEDHAPGWGCVCPRPRLPGSECHTPRAAATSPRSRAVLSSLLPLTGTDYRGGLRRGG